MFQFMTATVALALPAFFRSNIVLSKDTEILFYKIC